MFSQYGRFTPNLWKCEEILRQNNFIASKEYILDFPAYGPMAKVILDNQNQKIAFLFTGFLSLTIVHFNEVISSEVILQTGSARPNSAQNTLLGGVLFGPAGAIIGNQASKQIQTYENIALKVITLNLDAPAIKMTFIKGPIKKDNESAKRTVAFCEQVNGVLQGIIYQNQNRR